MTTTTYFIAGSNRGIGFQLAKQISQDSSNKVIATTRSLENAKALQDLKRSNLHIIEYDFNDELEDSKQKLEILDKIAPEGVDVVFQVAGISKDAQSSILDIPLENIQEHLKVNTFGPIILYKSIYKYWSKQSNSVTKKFFFISSSAGLINNAVPLPTSSYGLSKAALNFVVRHIAKDNSQSDIEYIKNSIVVALNPGLVETDMAKAFTLRFADMIAAHGVKVYQPEESVKQIIEHTTNLKQEETSSFIDVDGTKISW